MKRIFEVTRPKLALNEHLHKHSRLEHERISEVHRISFALELAVIGVSADPQVDDPTGLLHCGMGWLWLGLDYLRSKDICKIYYNINATWEETVINCK